MDDPFSVVVRPIVFMIVVGPGRWGSLREDRERHILTTNDKGN